MPTRWRRFVLQLACALGATPAFAGGPAIVYVNAAGGCDYPSIQAAIDDLAPGSEIRLAGAEFVTTTPLGLFNRRLRIAGGYPACGAPEPTGKTTLRAGFSGDPVVNVFGDLPGALSVELRDLVITEGDNPNSGGGLFANGFGQVNLVAVDVVGNSATTGGGLHAAASGGVLGINLLGGSRIGGDGVQGNVGTFGAGIYCDGARLRLGHTTIRGNVASSRGGGMYLDGCEVISSNEVGDLRIEHNRARDGGGLYAVAGSQITLRSRLQQTISISHNEASMGAAPNRGGGAFLSGAGTRLEASGVHVDNNLARSFGGGLMLQGAEAHFDRNSDGCTLGDSACSRLSGNTVRNAVGALSGSAAAAFIAGSGSPRLSLAQTQISGNSAAGSIIDVGDAGSVELSSVLIAANQSNGALLQLFGTATLQGDFLTVADNLVPGVMLQQLSDAPTAVQLRRSILQVETGSSHLGGNGSGGTVFDCLNTGPGGALGGTTHDPGFADADSGNYRLAPGSGNFDRCAIDGNEDAVDIAGFPRIVDRPGTANAAGAADRGAHENNEQLFVDGFED